NLLISNLTLVFDCDLDAFLEIIDIQNLSSSLMMESPSCALVKEIHDIEFAKL
ncbi:hypothetical protein Tco_0782730, partial [Tanacetum coccineum]